MKKHLLFIFALILASFSACSCISKQPLPEGMWECAELQAYFVQADNGQYTGTIGKERKTFQMKITVYGNECAFFYSDDPLPFISANYRIENNQMFLYQKGKMIYTFYRVDTTSK